MYLTGFHFIEFLKAVDQVKNISISMEFETFGNTHTHTHKNKPHILGIFSLGHSRKNEISMNYVSYNYKL